MNDNNNNTWKDIPKSDLRKSIPWKYTRLVVLGDSGAGKTSVVRWLKRQEFEQKHITTKGVDMTAVDANTWKEITFNIEEYSKVALSSESNNISEGFFVWDFAGQDEYYNTHHIFLNPSCVCLLVVNISQPIREERLKFWVDSIRFYTHDSPICLVGTHADVAKSETRVQAMNKLSSLQKYIRSSIVFISCKVDDDTTPITSLLEKAQKQKPAKLCKLSWMLFYDALSKKIQQYLPLQTATNIASQFEMDEQEVKQALAFFSDAGFILYQNHQLIDDIIFNPQDILEVLPKQLPTKHEGRLSPDMLSSAWQNFPTAIHDKLRALLQEFGLGFFQTSSDKESDLVIPCMVKDTREELLEKILKDSHEVRCRIQTIPPVAFSTCLLESIITSTQDMSQFTLLDRGCYFKLQNTETFVMTLPGEIIVRIAKNADINGSISTAQHIVQQIYTIASMFNITLISTESKCFRCQTNLQFRSEKFCCPSCQGNLGFGHSIDFCAVILRTQGMMFTEVFQKDSQWSGLCKILDEHSWELFAQEIGLEVAQFSRFKRSYDSNPGFSPTKSILEQWVPTEEATVGYLIRILETINNHDAREFVLNEVQQYLAATSPSQPEACVSGTNRNDVSLHTENSQATPRNQDVEHISIWEDASDWLNKSTSTSWVEFKCQIQTTFPKDIHTNILTGVVNSSKGVFRQTFEKGSTLCTAHGIPILFKVSNADVDFIIPKDRQGVIQALHCWFEILVTSISDKIVTKTTCLGCKQTEVAAELQSSRIKPNLFNSSVHYCPDCKSSGGKREFAESLDKDGTWYRMKIFLVGDGGAGKTSLLRWLMNQPFERKPSYTDSAELITTDVYNWRKIEADTIKQLAFMTLKMQQDINKNSPSKHSDPITLHQTKSNQNETGKYSLNEPQVFNSSKRRRQPEDSIPPQLERLEPELAKVPNPKLAKTSENTKILTEQPKEALSEKEFLVSNMDQTSEMDHTEKMTKPKPNMFLENRQFMQSIEEYKESLLKDDLPMTFLFWDFGGQEVYYNTHHFFLTHAAIYILVVDLSLNMETIEKRTMFWLRSIRSYSSKAPIVVVGTHKDKILESEESDKLAAILELVEPYANPPTTREIFAVDCSRIDIEFKQAVRELVVAIARQEAEKLKFPLRWLLFYHALDLAARQMDNNKLTTLSLQQAFEEAEKCGMQKNEVTKALQVFHELGFVLYYGNHEKLGQYVFMKPEQLVQVLRTIITLPKNVNAGIQFGPKAPRQSFSDVKLATKLQIQELKEHGRISNDLLRHLWRNYPGMFSEFRSLLETFYLAVPDPNQKSNFEERDLIVPCLVETDLFKKNILNFTFPKTVQFKILTAEQPLGLISRLTVKALTIAKNEDTECILFHGGCVFTFMGTKYKLLLKSADMIELTAQQDNQRILQSSLDALLHQLRQFFVEQKLVCAPFVHCFQCNRELVLQFSYYCNNCRPKTVTTSSPFCKVYADELDLQELCLILNETQDGGWRAVGEYFGFKKTELDGMASNGPYYRISPAELLIKTWQEREINQATAQRLINALERVNNEIAKQHILAVLNKNSIQ